MTNDRKQIRSTLKKKKRNYALRNRRINPDYYRQRVQTIGGN